jgi:hypothetical protein
MSASDVPSLVKHCVVAIWKDLSGGSQSRFVSAWNIARSRLVEYGYLAEGSQNADSSDIKLTSKGAKRSGEHRREPGAKSKEALFDKMFHWLEVAQDSKKGDGLATREDVASGESQNVKRTEPFVGHPPKPKKGKVEEPKSKLGKGFKPAAQLGKRLVKGKKAP